MIIQRLKSPSDRTNGKLLLPDHTEFPTLELPWRDNQVNISCIPAGNYRFKRDTHGRHQWFRMMYVPERTHIEFHAGGSPRDSHGCILISPECYHAMLFFYGDEKLIFTMEVRDYVWCATR